MLKRVSSTEITYWMAYFKIKANPDKDGTEPYSDDEIEEWY